MVSTTYLTFLHNYSINRSIEEIGANQTSFSHTSSRHLLWYGGLCSNSTVKYRFSFAKNTMWRKPSGRPGIQESAQQCTCITASVHINIQQFVCEFQAVQLQIQVLLHVILHCSPWHITLYWFFIGGGEHHLRCNHLHMIKLAFLHQLCSQSLMLTRADVCFARPSYVASRGGALLNCSLNAFITWAIVWPVHSLFCVHTHLLLTTLLLNKFLCQP